VKEKKKLRTYEEKVGHKGLGILFLGSSNSGGGHGGARDAVVVGCCKSGEWRE